MMHGNRKDAYGSRRKLTVAVGAVLFLAGMTDVEAATYVVDNCNDRGAGSLRAGVVGASSGDVVDMSNLTTASPGCSTSVITLEAGEIGTSVDDITIVGPVNAKILVEQSENQRVFTHAGTGTFKISNLQITYGSVDPSRAGTAALGGCIYSSGSIELDSVVVTQCSVHATGAHGSGGAVYALKGITLNNSVVTASQAVSTGTKGVPNGRGGGIASAGMIVLRGSNVSGNSADVGGGIWSYRGQLNIYSSLLSGNDSSTIGGAVYALDNFGLKLVNSTVAANTSEGDAAGVYASMDAADVTIANSTIAFNVQTESSKSAGIYLAQFGGSSAALSLNSTLVSNNTAGGAPNDTTFGVNQLSGANNLIFAPAGTVPGGTIVGVCPRLGGLRDNGGPTQTLSLQSGSAAIDAGNNVMPVPLGTDQRMDGYPRSSGSGVDIGAYEVQKSDIVFTANLEGCP